MSTIILGIEVTVLFCVVAISIIWTILQERFHNLCLHFLHLVMLGIIVLIAYIGGYDIRGIRSASMRFWFNV